MGMEGVCPEPTICRHCKGCGIRLHKWPMPYCWSCIDQARRLGWPVDYLPFVEPKHIATRWAAKRGERNGFELHSSLAYSGT